jgi:hypothetical protein
LVKNNFLSTGADRRKPAQTGANRRKPAIFSHSPKSERRIHFERLFETGSDDELGRTNFEYMGNFFIY